MKKLLIIVDMQNDFVTGTLANEAAEKIVDKIAEYAEGFDGDIMFTQDTHTIHYMHTQEGRHLPIAHCIKNRYGWQIVDALKNIPGRKFYKPTFGSIELAKELRRNYADAEIYFVGTCTGICVLSNAIMAKAFVPEAKLFVLQDLCACVTEETHKTALKAMALCHINIV